jgi:hypothetical protein
MHLEKLKRAVIQNKTSDVLISVKWTEKHEEIKCMVTNFLENNHAC